MTNSPKRMPFSDFLRAGVALFDGAMGTEIYRNHVFTNQCYDNLNRVNPDLIRQIHQSYYDAGVDVLVTNTFGANRVALEKYGFADQVRAINLSGAQLAREVADQDPNRTVYVAGSVGPLPLGAIDTFAEQECVAMLADQVGVLIEGGCDFIMFETMTSRAAADRAVRAMTQYRDFPFMLSFCLARGTETTCGDSLETLFAPLPDDMPQPFAFGLNCGRGPDGMLEAVERAVKITELPIVVQPNAGIPKEFEGRQLYYCSPEYITQYAQRYITLGAAAVGGCCGTTPAHLKEMVNSIKPLARSRSGRSSVRVETASAKARPETPLEQRSALAGKLVRHEWITAVELVPPRGFDLTRILENCRVLQSHGVDVVNLPDGPRASSRISSLVVAERIKREVGIEPVLHVCCRDRNLIGLQADLLACAACDIHNILFITGDPPRVGKYPDVTAVFDTDSIGMIHVQTHLNQGLDIGQETINAPTSVCIGAGLDPTSVNRDYEIDRFRRKVAAGAHFAVTQPVFDFDAFCRFLDDIGDSIPVIAGVWPLLNYKNTMFMKHEVPGVIVPDVIAARMEAVCDKDEDTQLAVGMDIAHEAIELIRSRVAGVQVSAPRGRIDLALRLLGLS